MAPTSSLIYDVKYSWVGYWFCNLNHKVSFANNYQKWEFLYANGFTAFIIQWNINNICSLLKCLNP